MYFQESDSILSENQELRETIIALDEHLYSNQDGYVRLEPTAELLDIAPNILQNLLNEYVEREVVSLAELPICKKCDIPIEDDHDPLRCDLCDRQFELASLKKETVYFPRATLFECGDEISKEILTSYDVDGIFKIAGCNNKDRVADVIFVHGLGGNAKETWHPENQPDKFWPKWIHEKIPNVGVWTIEYEAAQTAWTGSALSLPDRAADVLGRLSLAGLGNHPIIFVTHSLGGLVVKELLQRGTGDQVADWMVVANAVRGVMFIATPHSGSDLSTYLKYVSAFARTTPSISDLEAHHPRLRASNVWFRNNFTRLKIRVGVLYETKPTTKFKIGAMVVDATSADPGIPGIAPEPVELDHVEICKPESKSSKVFLHTVRLIEKVISDCGKQ
ncbi:MAG: hypothetical protein SFV81_17365 [Pirellulaceae bacterium]|nr:hypothetical protein [Pirellulaceae bacterium]